MYAQARLQVSEGQPPMVVPTSAVVFDATGTKVWLVDRERKIHQQKVDVGRDLGTEVEISNGLSGDESVVTNPGERMADGALVQLTGASGEAPRAQQQQAAAAR